MFEIRQYSQEAAKEWNAFVVQSKNGTFLFDRNYMDYHGKRFADFSLMFYQDGTLLAVLPANRDGESLISHGGLTYGGLVMCDKLTAFETLVLFAELNDWLRCKGVKHVVYKPVPHIYHTIPSEEDLYALTRECGAQLTTREISSTIAMSSRLKWCRDRRYGINKARNNNVEVVADSDDWENFWQVLDENLMHNHGVRPIHSLDEIKLLKSRFPHNIVLYVAQKDGKTIGGTVLYVTRQVVHAQYISANKTGKHLRVIDAIYDQVLNEDFTDFKYFDFGKSTENHGHMLNESLIYQKEGFGGRAICYDTYEWNV